MPAAKPTTRNPERTKRSLLKAAIKLFSARGFHGVSVDELVDLAKVNKRMVYHYFSSKDGLYAAALHEVYGRIEKIEFDAVEGTGSPRQKLERLLANYFQFLADNPDFTRFLQWENLDNGRHLGKQDHPLTKSTFMDRFRQVVEAGIKSGEFRKDLDVVHLMIHLIGLCSIYHSNRFSLTQSLGIDLRDEVVLADGLRQVVRLVMDGIRSA